MLENTTVQQPATENQIQVQRPTIKKTTNILPGHISGSMNGGHYKVMEYIPVMQGQEAHVLRGTIQFQTLTPLTPAYQKLRFTILACYVPNSAVMTDYEEFYAQKGGTSVTKIQELPNFKLQEYPIIGDNIGDGNATIIYNTQQWRDSFISSYIARPGVLTFGEEQDVEQTMYCSMPRYSALGARGYVCLWNHILRNKEYDEERVEYKGNTVTAQEMSNYMPVDNNLLDFYFGRAKRDNSYYTNYRTELQGIESIYPPNGMSADEALSNWMKWEQDYSQAKKMALDSQRSAWQILAEERGAKIALQGKPQIIGKKSFYLNYSSITQNSYNSNTEVEDKYRVMGFQGAFSYTNIDMPLFENITFEEDGIIHLIGICTAETVFTSGLNRQMLNVGALEVYRPELAENKQDVLYKIETRTSYALQAEMDSAENEIIGFKRRYSEYFSLPTCVNGDMMEAGYYKIASGNNEQELDLGYSDFGTIIDSNDTYQFYENNPEFIYMKNVWAGTMRKKIWLDYTDLQINKNLAVPANVRYTNGDGNANQGGISVDGQNQIIYVGELKLITTLPIDEAIKNDFLKWGEH